MLFAAVPKTRVYKYYRYIFWQNYVRLAEISRRIFSVTKTVFPKLFTKGNLHFTVSTLYSRHHFASLLFGNNVHAIMVPLTFSHPLEGSNRDSRWKMFEFGKVQMASQGHIIA